MRGGGVVDTDYPSKRCAQVSLRVHYTSAILSTNHFPAVFFFLLFVVLPRVAFCWVVKAFIMHTTSFLFNTPIFYFIFIFILSLTM